MAFENLKASEWVELNVKLLGETANYSSLLCLAMNSARLDVLDFLVANGVDINSKINEDGDMLIHIAAFDGNIEALKYLLEHGVKVDARNNKDQTPMRKAAWAGRVDVMKYLKERGANLYARDKDGFSPIDCAVVKNQIESIKCFKELGANLDIRDSNGETALHQAAKFGNLESINCLKELGADVNARDNNGCTPIHAAAMAGKAGSIKCLAVFGTDVNAKDNDGITPMFMAAAAMDETGQVECVKCLAEFGADIEIRNNNGQTPIFAAVCGQIASMECLNELGAKLDAKDNNGKTALDFAVNIGKVKAAEWLKERYLPLQYEQFVQEMDKASTDKEYQELTQKFRSMNGYKDTAELADKCDTQYRILKERREEQERQGKYKRLVNEADRASTEKKYQELSQEFRSMKGYKDTAALADKCDTQYRILKERREEQERKEDAKYRRKERLEKFARVIARISPFLLAVLFVVISLKVLSDNSDYRLGNVFGSIFLAAIPNAIPFFVVYFSDSYEKVRRVVWLTIGIILNIILASTLGKSAKTGEGTFLVAAFIICNLVSYILAMIFPKGFTKKSY